MEGGVGFLGRRSAREHLEEAVERERDEEDWDDPEKSARWDDNGRHHDPEHHHPAEDDERSELPRDVSRAADPALEESRPPRIRFDPREATLACFRARRACNLELTLGVVADDLRPRAQYACAAVRAVLRRRARHLPEHALVVGPRKLRAWPSRGASRTVTPMRIALPILLLAACSTPTTEHTIEPRAPTLDARFTGATLRFDYDHVGTASAEYVAPHAYRIEGAWAGSATVLEDPSGLGLYRFIVRDAASSSVLWSRGFCSIFGEWATTGPAKTTWRSFQESQRFPEPVGPVVLALEKRDERGAFREFWRGDLDPKSRFVDRVPAAPWITPIEFEVNGPPATQVDLLLLAEGYAQDGQAKFEADAHRMIEALFKTEPWKSRRGDVSVRGIFVSSSKTNGISNPRKSEWRRSVFGTSFNAFDSDRYVLTYERIPWKNAGSPSSARSARYMYGPLP